MVVTEKNKTPDDRIPYEYRRLNVSSIVVRIILGMTKIVRDKIWGFKSV